MNNNFGKIAIGIIVAATIISDVIITAVTIKKMNEL